MKFLAIATVLLLLLVQTFAAVPYPHPADPANKQPVPSERNLSEDYNDSLDNLLLKADKRACIRRGGNCDGKENNCCENSACRCNLWGTNCRCDRAGLFQQWGK